MSNQPLAGIRVLDFSTLLPGPLATLLLVEAGATVVKVERPGSGESGRSSRPLYGGETIDFALLNRGKKSIALDLKAPQDLAIARRLANQADVLVEQFRPGVMTRLGLGYEALCEENIGLVYCAITGYGQNGPLQNVAAHDLNYLARSGMLGLSVDDAGKPVLPQGNIADVGGGSYPAVMNILLALMQRQQTGRGCYLDIAMSENTFIWMRKALAPVLAGFSATPVGQHSAMGGSPRYQVYMALDGSAFAVAAIEQQFWARFCDLIGLPAAERDDQADPHGVKSRIASLIALHPAAYWESIFAGEEVCVERVRSMDEVLDDPHFRDRGVFAQKLLLKDERVIPALPVPLARHFLVEDQVGYPALGETKATDPAIWQR